METRYPRECCDYDMKVTNVTLRDMMGQNMNVENILSKQYDYPHKICVGCLIYRFCEYSGQQSLNCLPTPNL